MKIHPTTATATAISAIFFPQLPMATIMPGATKTHNHKRYTAYPEWYNPILDQRSGEQWNMGDFTFFSYSTAGGFTWWNLVPSAVGAILGATASLGPAFLMARHTRKQIQKAATRKGMVKLNIMVNAAEAVHRAIEESIAEKEPQLGADAPTWQKVLPMTGHSIKEARFEAEEISIFMDREEDSPFGNDLILAGEKFIGMQHAVAEYNRRRLAFTDLLSDQLSKYPDGKLPTEVRKALDLRTIEVEALAVGIRKESQEIFDMLVDLAHGFGPKARAVLNDKKFPRLDVSEARKRQAARKQAAADAVSASVQTDAIPTTKRKG